MHITTNLTALLALALTAAAPALAAPGHAARHIPYEIKVTRYSNRDCGIANQIPSERSVKITKIRGNKCKTFNPNDSTFMSYRYTHSGNGDDCLVTAYDGADCTGQAKAVDAVAGREACQNVAVWAEFRGRTHPPNMYITTKQALSAILAIALASPAMAKKANYKIKLGRYTDENCGSDSQIGKFDRLHNNKCKTWAHGAPFPYMLWAYNDEFDYTHHGVPAAYDDDDCLVTVYSEPQCQGQANPYDATNTATNCVKIAFGLEEAGVGRSVSVTCNGNKPDNV
ncbi:hypothetical protein LTR36_009855 [Oleoguttula mirabilis]|uniref:Uncharacterized protein n=1 Tax=Oleoguttula mirabilis TaxID=1507867 RepID=A0AAV9J4Y7_9PEZI|nr:hypothetical protein LTR36_009855 [Oleoguttula mirabilis]